MSRKRDRFLGDAAEEAAADDPKLVEPNIVDDEDEWSEEEIVDENEDENEEDEEEMGDGEAGPSDGSAKARQVRFEEEEEEEEGPKQVYVPGVTPLEEGEKLEYDSRAYDLYHSLQVEWPCLSFDIIRDNLGNLRNSFPVTLYMVAGTQASRANQNKILLMKMSDLHRTKYDEDDEDDSGSENSDDLDDDPILESRAISHMGGVNRIRSMPQQPHIIATWADQPAAVHMWDLSADLRSIDRPGAARASNTQPLFSFKGHATEGFSMDWSPITPGRFLSGDCKKFIYLWNPTQGKWEVDKMPFTGHTESVEDIQWSASVPDVFASCSADCTIKVWDARGKRVPVLSVNAHESDVNVISWKKAGDDDLLVSGSDDGSFRIWDLRNFVDPTAHFKWHTQPITSVSWHPFDDSVLAVSGSDNQITIWDLAVEEDIGDPNSVSQQLEGVQVPPQLMFIHQGQEDIKEIKWHPQISGVMVSTAADGFNVFKPENIK
eukprot:TRINITY_DN520_c0_g1_i2.p1 TRINITY_DN520_c0_g1~~TRINITY_DN520_c0_g1_i2.p1  ORF type:complete len:490 (-),score=126.08 TRINITY_DN520_c0_g1_i2:297-1766(-)